MQGTHDLAESGPMGVVNTCGTLCDAPSVLPGGENQGQRRAYIWISVSRENELNAVSGLVQGIRYVHNNG